MKYVIEGFELLATDSAGVRDDRVAIMKYEADAKAWANESKGYRSYRFIREEVVVHESLESLVEEQRQELIARALMKLTPQERAALGHPAGK